MASLLLEGRELHVSAAAPADGTRRLEAVLERVSALLPEGRIHPRRRRGMKLAEGDRVARDGRRLITDLRAVKSDDEIELIRRAVDATVHGIRDALRFARPGVAEYQLAAIVEFRCKSAGCARQAFDSIAGSGPNSCILHYGTNDRITEDGDLVVLDVGGEYRGYAADVTRTFPVNGKFSAEQARVYDAVLEAQLAALDAVKPGVTLREIHAAAKAVLDRHELGQYFIHGTSHSVGLNVHDPFGRARKLSVGSVLTVEPGAYLAHKSLGVRIEDTVVVTEDGCEILSAGVPKTRAEIEKLMAEPPPLDVPLPRQPNENR